MDLQDRLTEQLKYSILFILVILNIVQISSNGENVIGESVTRHFTGEFSVYSMAVRPAGTFVNNVTTTTKDNKMHNVSGNNNEPLKVLVAAGHGEFCQVYQLSLQRSVFPS